ncbi:hypothetical protein U9M48_001710, partial [Paspalum notatum var. saurae]
IIIGTLATPPNQTDPTSPPDPLPRTVARRPEPSQPTTPTTSAVKKKKKKKTRPSPADLGSKTTTVPRRFRRRRLLPRLAPAVLLQGLRRPLLLLLLAVPQLLKPGLRHLLLFVAPSLICLPSVRSQAERGASQALRRLGVPQRKGAPRKPSAPAYCAAALAPLGSPHGSARHHSRPPHRSDARFLGPRRRFVVGTIYVFDRNRKTSPTEDDSEPSAPVTSPARMNSGQRLVDRMPGYPKKMVFMSTQEIFEVPLWPEHESHNYSRRKRHNSDDGASDSDFVNPTVVCGSKRTRPSRRPATKRKRAPRTETRRANQAQPNDGSYSIASPILNVRCNPGDVVFTITLLTRNQYAALVALGFGPFLSLLCSQTLLRAEIYYHGCWTG